MVISRIASFTHLFVLIRGCNKGYAKVIWKWHLYDTASCAPVGMAWKKSIAIDSTINLYSSDNSHPSIYGSYLAACTFYQVFLKRVL